MSHGQSVEADGVLLQCRPDLEIIEQRHGGRRVWVVKDPLSMSYYQLGEIEHFILSSLREAISLDRLRAAIETRFAPRTVTLPHLQALLGQLYRQNLLASKRPGQATSLLERRRKRIAARRWAMLMNPLAIRFPGVDPDRWLDQGYSRVRWLFAPTTQLAVILFWIASLILGFANLNELVRQIPRAGEFFAPANLGLVLIGLAVVKVLHELGHGLTCRHFGGECHEIGIMLLVFAPTLYCDVSDTWMLRSKWRRAAVAAAGIYVELVIGSLCLWLWWLSEPGLFNTCCFNLLLICTVSTLLVNGNPLLRYDSYFILSDLLGVPNLWQTSRSCLRIWLRRVCLGIRHATDWRDGREQPEFLIGYALLSTAYRLVLVTVILTFIHDGLRQQGLSTLGNLIVAAVATMLLASPLREGVRYLSDPAARQRVRQRNLFISSLALLLVLLLVLLLPLPHRVGAPALIEPAVSRRLYAPADGKLVEATPEGAVVTVGQSLLRLEDLKLEREIERLRGELNRRRIRLRNLEALRSTDPAANAALPETAEAARDLDNQLQLQLQVAEKMQLTADIDGQLWAPPLRIAASDGEALPQWQGQPLQPRNRGAFIKRGELLAIVAPPDQHQAVLYVDEGSVSFLEEGQTVRLSLRQLGWLRGEVASISQTEVDRLPPELAEQTANETASDGSLRPLETLYQVRVRLTEQPGRLVFGASGRASVNVGGRSLGSRVWRWLRRNFSRRLF